LCLNRQSHSKARGEDGGNGKSRESKIHAKESIPPLRRGKPEKYSITREEAAEMGSRAGLTLAGLETPVRLVDDIDAALAAHDAIVAMAAAQRFK
jgi:hypothetical protein